ncbi:MAG: hypothetical protein R3263_13020, partial [Myxococcota bacterium]|nr:hypothetical protein [Myxococcota bacterium]
MDRSSTQAKAEQAETEQAERTGGGAPRGRAGAGLLALLALALLGALGAECRGGAALRILEPRRDLVETFVFRVAVRVPEGFVFDPATGVEINGAPIPVTPAAETDVWEATVQPGYPLLDENELVVHARLRSGADVTAERFFVYGPPKARASRVEREDQLLRGPLAHGRLGDWLLENGEARFVVQDVGKRDLYSVAQFGGNLIDAGLRDRDTPDNFLEIQPMVNIETVVNAQTVEVVNDGQDGTAAILRTCGPDDLLDFVNPSSLVRDAGLPFPPLADDRDLEVEGCTEFRLEPEVPWIRLETTIFNNQPSGATPA